MSTAWNRGYPVHDTYPLSWHHEQSPYMLKLACDMLGVAWDMPQSLSYCDLGCASGYTALILAAANPDWQVTGIEYNPTHVTDAQAMAREAGIGNARFLEADLAEMTDAELDRLPELDVVTLHGFWTWVGDPVRQGVVRLLRRRLKPGGIVMVGFNSMPGCASALGLQRLARAAFARNRDPKAAKAELLEVIQALGEAGAPHLLQSHWLHKLREAPDTVGAQYLLHEMATAHWNPVYTADLAAALSDARLEFAGSMRLDENFPQLTVKPALQKRLETIEDPIERQTLIDYAVLRPFRTDIFVRGLRRVDPRPLVDGMLLAGTSSTPGVLPMTTMLGQTSLPDAVMLPILEALQAGPRRVADLAALPSSAGVPVTQILLQLAQTGAAMPMPRPGARTEGARRMNLVSARRSRPGAGVTGPAFAAPALGGGLPCKPVELALLARMVERPEAPVDDPVALARELLPPAMAGNEQHVRGAAASLDFILRRRVPVYRELGIL